MTATSLWHAPEWFAAFNNGILRTYESHSAQRSRTPTPLRKPDPKSEPRVDANRVLIHTAIPECPSARTAHDLPGLSYKNGYSADQEIHFGYDPCTYREERHHSPHPPNLILRRHDGHEQRWLAFQRKPLTQRGEN
jgi:hypothetical protein